LPVSHDHNYDINWRLYGELGEWYSRVIDDV